MTALQKNTRSHSPDPMDPRSLPLAQTPAAERPGRRGPQPDGLNNTKAVSVRMLLRLCDAVPGGARRDRVRAAQELGVVARDDVLVRVCRRRGLPVHALELRGRTRARTSAGPQRARARTCSGAATLAARPPGRQATCQATLSRATRHAHERVGLGRGRRREGRAFRAGAPGRETESSGTARLAAEPTWSGFALIMYAEVEPGWA